MQAKKKNLRAEAVMYYFDWSRQITTSTYKTERLK